MAIIEKGFLISYSSAAKQLGVTRFTISDCARVLGITPKPMSGKGKGLDAADLRRLRKFLRVTSTSTPPSATAKAS